MAIIADKARGDASRTPRLHAPDHQTASTTISNITLGRERRDRSRTRLANAWGSAHGVPGNLESSTAWRAIVSRHGVLRRDGDACGRNRPSNTRPHTYLRVLTASCARRVHMDRAEARRAGWRRGKGRKRRENQCRTPTGTRQRAAATKETKQTHKHILGARGGYTKPN